MAKIFTVSEINKYTSDLIKTDPIIGHTIEIEGEVSEISLSQVGHIYFVIKDSESQIKVNFFKTSRAKCKIELKRGMSVICTEFSVLIFGENWLFFLDSIKTSLYSVLYFILVSDMV